MEIIKAHGKTKLNRFKNRSIFYIFLALVFGCGQNAAKSNKDLVLEDKFDSLFSKQYKEGKLNGNILIVRNNKIIYEKSFGYADGSKSVMLNKDFRFNIGSVYKEFPAVAIMQLSEKKLLDTDDKINKYLFGLPTWSKQISIKHLLQYSSGLPKIEWDKYFSKNLSISDEDIFSDLKKIRELEFEPEADYLYTNYSPILLMKIVESISKKSFRDYALEQLFIPFGLNDTVIKNEYPYRDKTLMAIPFDSEFTEDNYKTSVSGILFSSTTGDMYKWFDQLNSLKIISKESVRFLSKEAKPGENIQSPLGRSSWDNNTINEHSHHGSSGNYECVVRKFKQDGLTIVILTNQKHNNVYALSDKVREIIKNNG